MFYGDKKLSFILFEYIIVSKYVFEGCLVVQIIFVKFKSGLKGKGNTVSSENWPHLPTRYFMVTRSFLVISSSILMFKRMFLMLVLP